MADIAQYLARERVSVIRKAYRTAELHFVGPEAADYRFLMQLWNLRARMAFLIDNLQFYLQVVL